MENEKKSAGVAFKKWWKNFFLGIVQSFQYNRMKLPGLLVAVPGIFLGFFLKFHSTVVLGVTFSGKATYDPVTDSIVQEVLIKPFDFMGISMFLLVLLGILNLFTAASMMSKKNLGSVVVSTITTALILISGILYFYCIIHYFNLKNSGQVSASFGMCSDLIVSMITVGISMVTSLVGVILGYIFYDRTYEKVDR